MEGAQIFINWKMDKGEVVYILYEILISYQKEWYLAICNVVDGTKEYYGKVNKSVIERQISYDFTQMNRTEEHRGRKREPNQKTDS